MIGRPPTGLEKDWLRHKGRPITATREFTVGVRQRRTGLLRIPIAFFRRRGDLHAIAIIFNAAGNGMLLDPAMQGPQVLTRYHFQ